MIKQMSINVNNSSGIDKVSGIEIFAEVFDKIRQILYTLQVPTIPKCSVSNASLTA